MPLVKVVGYRERMGDCTVVQRVNSNGLSLGDIHHEQLTYPIVDVDGETSRDGRNACSTRYCAEQWEDCIGKSQRRHDGNNYDQGREEGSLSVDWNGRLVLLARRFRNALVPPIPGYGG